MFDSISATAVVAGVSLVAAIVLGARTNRLFRTACGGQVDIVDIELAWDFEAFSTMLTRLGSIKKLDTLIVGHYWDCGFAIAYSIAICSLLQLLAGHLPSEAGAALYTISWLGLAAGALDLFENLCLLRRFEAFKREYGKDPVKRPADGLLRAAAVAAALKFVLLGFCSISLVWGILQRMAHCLTGA